jgi:hypothetical protein
MFTSSNFTLWLSIEKSLRTLVEAFHMMNPRSREDPDEELKYMIQGQDLLYDLVCLYSIQFYSDWFLRSGGVILRWYGF